MSSNGHPTEQPGERTARIGLIRAAGGPADSVEDAQRELLDLCERCLEAGADIVCMPEGYQYRTARRNMLPRELAAYAPGFKERCAGLARRHQAYVVSWDYEIDAAGRVYNSSYVLDRAGEEVGRYRKTHQTYNEECRGLSLGMDYPVFDLDFGKVGIMICFDNYYPEPASILALRGAELILYPLWGDTVLEQWELRLRTRAIDHSVFIAPCCVSSRNAYTGIVAPDGNVLAALRGRGEWRVQPIRLGESVITWTSAVIGKYEDYRPYIRRKRNPASYAPLMEAGDVRPWEEILIERPGERGVVYRPMPAEATA